MATATFEALRADRLQAVGTHFLRARPLVALVGGGLNAAIFASADVAGPSRWLLPLSLGSLLVFFVAEALVFRGRVASERWLFSSLALTSAMLGVGCAVSGGLGSPLLPLCLTPTVIGFAAFGRAPRSSFLFALAAAVLGGLGLVSARAAPVIAGTPALSMTLVATVVSLVLVRLGVAELAEAYVETGRALDRLRLEVLDESLRRARESETLGAKVAHEIKNPLSAVKGLGQLVREDVASERSRERLDVLLSEVDRIDALVRSYLSLARPLRDLVLEDVELGALLDELAALLEARALGAGVALVRSGDRSVRVRADRRRLREALLNLAENAIRAMPRGGRLTLAAEAGGAEARLVVADEGRGMSEDELRSIEKPFSPGEADGTGLGLALARGVAAQHGGSLALRSAPGRGTTATITLPRTPGAPS